ncbi:putative ribonuclease H-like domain-containing protein [Tanacetum coccineum]|uniref:Ribonuclease H-like domain-containing protein n=1 Tax=Tanacetum coccineum TaxID=301880 RepID=A0ABQ5A545_9ASTR
MGDEYLDTIPSVEELIIVNSNDDDTSSDNDDFEDIEYVEESPPDLEIVSLEESPSPFPIPDSNSFFEKSNTSLSYSDNSLPEFESFSDHTDETSSGSTTTHANNSLTEYDSFHFEIEPDQGELTNVVMEDILGEPRVIPQDHEDPCLFSILQSSGLQSSAYFGILNPDHTFLLSFHDAVDARSLGKAIKVRFGGNEASIADAKKMLWKKMDHLRWQVAMITARIRKFMRKTGRPIDLKPKNGITFDKSKIECFNCQKLGHFARECRFAKYQENRATMLTYALMALTGLNKNGWSMEFDAEHVHFGQDGLGDFDWSNKADDAPVSLALMATNSEVPYCSKCSKSYKKLLEKLSNLKGVIFKELGTEILGFGIESSNSMESDISSGDETLTDSTYENFKREKAYKAVPPPTGQSERISRTMLSLTVIKEFLSFLQFKFVMKIWQQRMKLSYGTEDWGMSTSKISTSWLKAIWFGGLPSMDIQVDHFVWMLVRVNCTGHLQEDEERTVREPLEIATLWICKTLSEDNRCDHGIENYADSKETKVYLVNDVEDMDDQQFIVHTTQYMPPVESTAAKEVKLSSEDQALHDELRKREEYLCKGKRSYCVFSTNSFDVWKGGVLTTHKLGFYIDVPSTPTLRILISYPQSTNYWQKLLLGVNKKKASRLYFKSHQALLSFIYKQNRTNHKDQQTCLFACFLSQEEPKKVSQALADEKLEAQGGIGIKWVFRNKRDEVARIEAIRLFLAFASFMGFTVYQMDVKSAFLYGNITEEVYVKQPPGFEDPAHPNKVYRVVKSLYGLHQAPRAWYERLSTFLLKHGYRRGAIDKTLFIKKDRRDIMLVQVYVDDIIFGSTKSSMVKDFEDLMQKEFKMCSMEVNSLSFLGLPSQAIQWWSMIGVSCSLDANQTTCFWINFMHTEIHIDNESTICIVKNPVFHSKTKHIQIRHHFIRDCYEQRLINVVKVHTDDNVADLLTTHPPMALDLAKILLLGRLTIGMMNP